MATNYKFHASIPFAPLIFQVFRRLSWELESCWAVHLTKGQADLAQQAQTKAERAQYRGCNVQQSEHANRDPYEEPQCFLSVHSVPESRLCSSWLPCFQEQYYRVCFTATSAPMPAVQFTSSDPFFTWHHRSLPSLGLIFSPTHHGSPPPAWQTPIESLSSSTCTAAVPWLICTGSLESEAGLRDHIAQLTTWHYHSPTGKQTWRNYPTCICKSLDKDE